MKVMKLNQEQKQLIQDGWLKKLTASELKVYLTIQSYMNSEVSFPSQRTISEKCGLAVSTVTISVSSLTEKGLIERELFGETRKRTVYNSKDSTVSTITERKFNAKTFIEQFCDLYKKVYGVDYTPFWKRDGVMVKTKLISKYTDEQLEAILTIGVTEYHSRWSNNKFKRPTLGALCTWIVNEALAIHDEREKLKNRFGSHLQNDQNGSQYSDDLDKYFQGGEI